MIEQSELVRVGSVGKSHGLAGEMNVNFDLDVDLEPVPYVVLEMDGIFVPFFIESYRYRNDMLALVSFEGIGTEAGARELYGKDVYVKRELMPDGAEEESLLSFIGYRLEDEKGREIGEIEDVDDSTENVLLVVGEHLIPAAALEVVDVCRESRVIKAALPEGLTELIAG